MTKTLKTLSQPEETKLLYHLQRQWKKPNQRKRALRNYFIALLMLDTGIRVGELVQLRVNQLYYAGSPVGALCIEQKQAKRNSERTIPITERLHEAIEKMNEYWWSSLPDNLRHTAFLQHHTGKAITTRQIQRIICKASEISLSRSIHPHVLRHTFATKLMRTCNIRVVQQLLGHKSLQSTQIYTHPNSQDLQKAINTLNEVKS